MLSCLGRIANDPRIAFHLTPTQVDRKIRLFYCGLCRLRWSELAGDAIRHAVGVIEEYADGRCKRSEWARVRQLVVAVERTSRWTWHSAAHYSPTAAALATTMLWASEVGRVFRNRWSPSSTVADDATQATLLREIFDNPFKPVVVNPRWLTTAVVSVARAINLERSFELMDVLGDALQDAGCDCPVILDHCYGTRTHARGCWLLDSILGNG